MYISYDVPGQARPGLCDRPKHVFHRASVWPAHACCVLTLARQPRGIVLSTLAPIDFDSRFGNLDKPVHDCLSWAGAKIHSTSPLDSQLPPPLLGIAHLDLFFRGNCRFVSVCLSEANTQKIHLSMMSFIFDRVYYNRDIGQFRISFWLHRLE